ncbi:MAG: hypothetical protein K2X91_03015, partial [Thermoleophilia bacterium]|nr:hypothetical protein [Thermoleophilia bacterium]
VPGPDPAARGRWALGDRGPIERLRFAAQRLVREHPPRLFDPNKALVHAIACPPGAVHRGEIESTRWAEMPLPARVDTAAAWGRVIERPGFYDYAPALGGRADAVEWHVNFADPELFVAYGSGLFAQDEMQVAEHPALGSLKEALRARGARSTTVEGGRATPILVMGVERRCRVATDPDPAEGRPHGLYGNRFAAADPSAVRRATTPIEPPTVTNLIAMAALDGGYGRYRADEIASLLRTAATAFRAAAIESARSRGDGCAVVVHTGFWGCGAFGGNRVLMTAIQVLAAEIAGLERLVLHTGDPSGDAAIAGTRRLFEDTLRPDSPLTADEVIARLDAAGFAWGVSDGN